MSQFNLEKHNIGRNSSIHLKNYIMPTRDNLRLRLDVLEARLARIRNEKVKKKLKTTRFLIKKSPESADPAALESEIEQVKQELTGRKIHHTAIVVRRLLKQFKATETLKIKKRMRGVLEPHGLEEELSVFKDLDLASEVLVRRMIHEKFPEKIDVPQTPNHDEKRFHDRFASKKAVREAIERLSQVLREIWGEQKTDEDLKDEPGNDENPERTHGSNSKEPHDHGENTEKSMADQEANVKTKNKVREERNGEEVVHQTDGQYQATEEQRPHDDTDMEDDAFFEEDLPTLPSLQGGYISGSDDSEIEEDPPELKPQRKNRRGQRARRQMWERRYGKRANHVVKAQREEEQEQHEKEEKRRQRELKRERWQKAQLERKQDSVKPLHPSWEARRQREIQQHNISFAGKKMKFE